MERRFETTIRFRVKAIRTFDYVLENWGVRVAYNFVDKLDTRLLQIKKYPEIGRPSGKNPKVRRILVGKQNILYYSNKRSVTLINNMFSSYGDPGKNPYG